MDSRENGEWEFPKHYQGLQSATDSSEQCYRSPAVSSADLQWRFWNLANGLLGHWNSSYTENPSQWSHVIEFMMKGKSFPKPRIVWMGWTIQMVLTCRSVLLVFRNMAEQMGAFLLGIGKELKV